MRVIWLLFLHFLLLLAMVGCQNSQKPLVETCDYITQDTSRLEELDNLKLEDAPRWVADAYGIEQSTIREQAAVDPTFQWLEWTASGKDYLMFFSEGSFLRLNVYFATAEPNGDLILECLGEPAYYASGYGVGEQPGFSLDLWYPNQGIVVEAIEVVSEVPPINGAIRFNSLRLVRAAPLEDMIQDVYSLGDVVRVAELPPLRRWPGTWDGVEVDIDPLLLDE